MTAVAPLPSPPPLSSPSSLSFSSSSASSSPASGADIKPLVVSAGGWRPRFMRGAAAAPPPTLAVAPPPADAPAAIRATSLPSAHNKGAGVDGSSDHNTDPSNLPDRSHSATAPPPSSSTSGEEVPFKRVTSLSSPSPTGSMTSTSSSDNGHHQQGGTDAFAMPVGSPTFYSQDSRPSPVFHGNTNSSNNSSNGYNSNPNSLLPRSTATFTKSPSRPHLLRSEANGHFAPSNGGNNNNNNNNTSPTYSNKHHIDVSSATSSGNNINNWNSLTRGSNTTNETMTPSHAAIAAPGLRSVQLDFQLLRQMRSDGVNGAYQIADAAGNRVIFKPNDEESFDVRTVPVSDIPSQDLAAALPAIAKQAAAAGFRGSKELVALARASSFLKNNNNNNNERMMHHRHSTSSINDENNSNSNNNSMNRRGGGSYIGQRSHGRGLHHRRRPRRGRGRTSQTQQQQQQSSAATTYTPPHIDTDDESSPASPDSSRRPSTTPSVDDNKQQQEGGAYDMDDSSSQHVDGAGESDAVLPSPPRHMSDALASLSSSTSDTLSLVNQYMTPYLAPSQSMRMFKHDNNPCGPGVPRGVAWVSGGRGRDLMLNIKVSPRRGVAYGDTTHKEWAAYLLDHGRFSGVPRTITASVNMYHGGTLLHTGPGSASSPHGHPHHHGGAMMGPTPLKRLTSSAGEDKHGSPPFTPSLTDSPPIGPLDGHHHHGTLQPLHPEPRYGSLQEFKEHICSAEDMGNSQFAVDEVHKVGILDLRLVNLDRHLGNILVAKVAGATPRDQYKLIPIDHGYILPDYRDIADVNFEWIHWKQCKEAFSAASLAYIASLDPVHDATLLKDVGVRNGSIITCVIATIMLQRAAAAGLSLFAIAEMAQRGVDDKEKSILERIVAQTDEEMAADDCHHHSSNGHASDGNGHITTDDEMDDDTIHAINRGRGAASTRGRGGSVGRGAGRGQNRSWGRAFTKTSRSAPLPTVASSPPSMDDEPLLRTSSGGKKLSSHGQSSSNNRRASGMTLEDQMDDNVHYLSDQAATTMQQHHRHAAHHHSHQLSQDSPRASSESPASHRQAELASFAKKKNLLTSPMVNPMASPSSHVRPAPLLRHASDQVYQNGIGMTLMPDSESPALKPVDNNSDDDEGMEALSLDGMTARIGSPVTSPTKSRAMHHQPHHHTTSHGFAPRSTRIAASPNWSASASPSTSPPSVSLFNRSNTGMATNSSAMFTSMSAAAGGHNGIPVMTRTTSTSGSATSSPGTSPPSMSPVGSPAFGSMPSSVPATAPKFKSSARARVTISDAVSKKRPSDPLSAPSSNGSNGSNGSGIPLARSRPVPIRAASTRIIDSGPNSAVTSPSTPLSPMAAIAASPPSPAAIPMRMPTPLQPLPSPSPPSPGVTHLTDTTMMFATSSSPPVSPPQGTVTSTPSTPSSASSALAPSSRVSPTGRTSVTITSATTSTTTTTSPTAVGTSAPSSSAAPSSASSTSLHSSSSGNSSVLHSTSSPPSSLSSWHAIPATSVSSSLTPSSTDTLTLPHAAVPLRSSSSMELVRAGNGNNLPRGANNRASISSSAGSTSSASEASSSSSDLPSVNETVPPRRYAWNEIWLRRFMKVVTGAVDHEVAKLVAAAAASTARSASASSSSSRTTSATSSDSARSASS